MPSRWSRALFGAPRNVTDPRAFHQLSLVAVLAWVGLGADGLSSSAYGPDEAFRALGPHTSLALFLAIATAATVFIIGYGYSRIIEQFPQGGGGYVVASRLLGPRIGLTSGAALLVDYVLTITISIASGADAIFSFVPPAWHAAKLPLAFAVLLLLTVLNLRGVKESVTALLPIFVLFLLTHAAALLWVFGTRIMALPQVTAEVTHNLTRSGQALGTLGLLKLFVHAYSMGGGTYTGIEAVSNGVPMMREPKVPTAQRTMVLMAVSLALTAGGLLLAYLLAGVAPLQGKTMNAVLFERVAGGLRIGSIPVGAGLVVMTLLSEGALLFVAAQAGFLDGPRVMANMAADRWLPRRFADLSERLSMHNGVLLMASAAAAAMVYTHGDVSKLVVMYSINVFLTFSLSNLAMLTYWLRHRRDHRRWWRHLPAHIAALVLCGTILVITIMEKFLEGGWVTVLITSGLVAVCFAVRDHYVRVGQVVARLDDELPSPPAVDDLSRPLDVRRPQKDRPTAILLVGPYGGLGRHALLTAMRMWPGHFEQVVFVSVAVIDSESFKGPAQVREAEERTRQALCRYERYAANLGVAADSRFAVATEVASEAVSLCKELLQLYPQGMVLAGQIVFREESLWSRLLHNDTAFGIQSRLQHAGLPMVVLPVRLDVRRTAQQAAAIAA